MKHHAFARRADELAAQGAAYVTATVVRAQRPTSAHAGDVALVTSDGTIQPFLPTPRVNVVGSKPIAAQLERLGPQLDLDIVAAGDEPADIQEGDLALIVAAHGRRELEALRAGIEAGLPYVGLVASPKRGAALIEELRAAGVPEEQLERIEVPAGIDINAKTPPEVALSILARIIERRHSEDYSPPLRAPSDLQAPTFATDPICGMTVTVEPGALQVRHDGEAVYFCAPGCKKTYEREHMSDPTAAASAAAPSGTAKRKVVTAVDPICGMTVLAVPETTHLEHHGETVYFCRDECKQEFQKKEQHAVAAE